MPESRQPTIYDIAESAGVSISTVSRVLNTPHLVNEKTRTKVMSVIDQLGFVPKASAVAHARKGFGRIGVLTPFFTAPSFTQRMRGIAAELVDTNYELVIYPVDSMNRLEGLLWQLPTMRQLDGLIIMSLPINENLAHRMIDNGLETVLIEIQHPLFSCVGINNFAGGELAARHIVQKGHHRCAFIDYGELPEFALRPGIDRLHGFQNELAQCGLDLPDEYIRFPKLSETGDASLQITQILKLKEPPTAIFAATDYLAMTVLRVARGLGLHVPDDLAVVGFDDIEVAEHIGLTTISQSLDESGKLAVNLLLNRLTQSSLLVQNVNIKLELVERETT